MPNHLVNNIKIVVTWGAIMAVVFGLISLLVPKNYRADSRVLVVVRDRVGMGSSAPEKMPASIAASLARIIYTQDFSALVLNSPNFNHDRWADKTPADTRALWRRVVRANPEKKTGFLVISAYSTPDDVLNFASAINQALVSHAWEYTGYDITIKVVDAPLVATWGARRPSMWAYGVVGFLVGIGLALMWHGWLSARVMKPRPDNL